MKKINKVELNRTNDGYVGAGTHTGQEEVNKRIEKLEIEVNCLRKQVRELQDFKGALATAAGAGIDLVVGDEEEYC